MTRMRGVVARYMQAQRRLAAEKLKWFPVGTLVAVDSPRYEGLGVVVTDASCPLSKLPVRIENGNVWYYEVTDCFPMQLPNVGGSK